MSAATKPGQAAAEEEIDAGKAHDPLWYKDAIIYQLHVKAFRDSDGDGMGDFRGMIDRLDYVADLGVNVIWLLPFYPSPMRDDGYDIADYRRINPAYGSDADFREFIREAHRRGIRVVTELVINHTSDQHPWFQAAREAPPGSPQREFYVWSDTDDKYAETRIIFTDTESSNWAWDPVAQQYYWHRFFSHQPDLNFANPAVVEAVIDVMRFWLDMGVDGLRLDAIPYLCEREGTSNENLPETHEVLKKMRAVVDEHYADRMFLAEANQWPEDVLEYFGDSDECHMAYHFPLMPRMYMAIAQEDRHPIQEILEQTPTIPDSCQWAIFLRNHDELTLEMVTDDERDYMYKAYARDPRARINVGIRRRLAPLMDNDVGRIKLLKSLLMSMPGSPILYYGDELGMGDNIFLGDRNSVRTPMQWSPDRNAGFSTADPQQLYLPPVMDPVYGYEAVNAEAQARDASSLLNWTRRIIAVRKSSPAFGRGSLRLLRPGNRHVFAYLREYQDEIVLCVANLAATAQPVELDLSAFKGRVPVDMMGRTPFPPIGELPYLLTMAGHGFFWFRLQSEAEVPQWHVEALPRTDLVTLVLTDGWDTFFPERQRRERQQLSARMLSRINERALPSYLRHRRWVAARNIEVVSAQVGRRVIYHTEAGTYLLLWATVRTSDGISESVFMPLATAWGSDHAEHIRELLPDSVARVRDRAQLGVLYEAFRRPGFCHALIADMLGGVEIESQEGRLRFSVTSAGPDILQRKAADGELQVLPSVAAHTVVFLGDSVFLKVYRHLRPGPNHELEINRFLTERTDFSHFPRLAGAVEFDNSEGATLLAMAQSFQRSQADARAHMLHYLERFLDEAQLRPPEATRETLDQAHLDNEAMLEVLGRRTGELHLALARPTGDPAFDPEPVHEADVRAWIDTAWRLADQTMVALEAALGELPDEAHSPSRRLLGMRRALGERIQAARRPFAGLRTRYHGSFHLRRVLIAENDFIITDFEGEPQLAAPERRRKHSPLRDVATMLRSLESVAQSVMQSLDQVRIGHPEVYHGFALDWQRRAASAFLRGYATVTEHTGLYGGTLRMALPMVDLFMVEKALYDIRDKLQRRPDRAVQPVSSLLQRLLYDIDVTLRVVRD